MFRSLGAASCRGGSTTSCARVVGRERVCASRRVARSVLLTSTPRADDRIGCWARGWARGPTHPCAALQRCAVRSTFVKRTPRAHSHQKSGFPFTANPPAVQCCTRGDGHAYALRRGVRIETPVKSALLTSTPHAHEHLQSCFDPSMVSWERLAPVRCAVCGVITVFIYDELSHEISPPFRLMIPVNENNCSVY